tara:strand:+ start:1022 stop:2341 length:1320 start_codon:yes stop_codon:yes gene_type:complete
MAGIDIGSTKALGAGDEKQSRSVLNQLVDVIQEDISGSATRKSYQSFVTGGIGPGITSSLYQTVYDQDFTLQTANPILDMTVGLYFSGSTVQDCKTGEDANGKLLFPSQSVMMREKVDIYRQYASALLGNANNSFTTPYGSSNADDQVDNAVFISFKRLFSRDKIKRETFAMKVYPQVNGQDNVDAMTNLAQVFDNTSNTPNLFQTATGSSAIYTDFGSSATRTRAFGGEVGNLVDSADSSKYVGLVFYDAGIAMLNVGGRGSTAAKYNRAFQPRDFVSGAISAMVGTTPTDRSDVTLGKQLIGSRVGVKTVTTGSIVPDLMVSASIDDIVDHFAMTRFSSGSLTAATFQNNTNINSNLVFCRATADEFNYSSNPTFTDSSNKIVVIEDGQEGVQRSFTYITTVGLYDDNDNLLAVAKLSRPIEKNDEKDLTVRVRLDF